MILTIHRCVTDRATKPWCFFANKLIGTVCNVTNERFTTIFFYVSLNLLISKATLKNNASSPQCENKKA